MRYYKLWKVKNGWLATDHRCVPDGVDGRGYDMDNCTIHHSLRAFADYVAKSEKKPAARSAKLRVAA
jgi:hypothetical protein